MTTTTCVHHLIYPMATGEFSTGTCKKCGHTQEGRNWEPQFQLNGVKRVRPDVPAKRPHTTVTAPATRRQAKAQRA